MSNEWDRNNWDSGQGGMDYGYGENQVNGQYPEKLHKWNWGACLSPIMFAFACNSWLCLLQFIPIINIFWWLVCGAKGASWAWNSGHYKNEDEFNGAMDAMNRMGIFALIVYGICVAMVIIAFVISLITLSNVNLN